MLPGMQILTWIFPSYLDAPETGVQSVHLRGKPLPEDDSHISRLLKWQESQKGSTQAIHSSTDLQRSSLCSPKYLVSAAVSATAFAQATSGLTRLSKCTQLPEHRSLCCSGFITVTTRLGRDGDQGRFHPFHNKIKP